jgi:hypothetical protein
MSSLEGGARGGFVPPPSCERYAECQVSKPRIGKMGELEGGAALIIGQ